MGIHADDLIEQGIDNLIAHKARECDDWCQYCFEEWEEDRVGEK